MTRRSLALGFALLIFASDGSFAQAQPRLGAAPSSAMSGSPGLGGPTSLSPGQGSQIIGGPPGFSVGRYQPSLLEAPTIEFGRVGPGALPLPGPPTASRIEILPPAGVRTQEDFSDSEGDEEGLTVEKAVCLLISNNLELRARFSEISQADADILTASLRTNPIFFADTQQIPYGSYNGAGTAIQYDVNMVHPLDLSHKRQARMRSAAIGREVVEARYRDAVRLAIDALYIAYVDALVAQVSYDRTIGKKRDFLAQIPVDEPESALRDTQRKLAVLLNIPPADLVPHGLRGRLQFKLEPVLPPTTDLVRIALANRPDLQTLRLAVGLADSDVRAVMANRVDDVLLLYQPYTFHDGRPADLRNSLAWALGVTVPMPIYNRQQGNLQKARLIAGQARTRLASLEQAVASEVQGAVLEHTTSHQAYDRTWNDVAKALGFLRNPQIDIDSLNVDKNVKEKLRQQEDRLKDLYSDNLYDKLKKYYEATVRHRRSMLRLNTATGVHLVE